MNDTLLIYYSETGFTKRYVDSFERRIPDLKIVNVKKLKKKDLKGKEYIFYIGPLRNNKILKLDKFLKYYKKVEDKNIFILCDGIEPISDQKKENVIIANGLNYYHVRLFLLPGGMDISKMSSFKRKIIMTGLKVAAKKEPNAGAAMSFLNNKVDFVDTNYLDRPLEVYHILKVRSTNKKQN